MARESAGILLFRRARGILEVFLVHPGGPAWKHKDRGAWTIPKGEFASEEDPLTAARREFTEETGVAPDGTFTPLMPVRQKAGKVVHAWAIEGDLDPAKLRSNTFTMEWPPRSGRQAAFPEVDRGDWFDMPTAMEKINPAQRAFLTQLADVSASVS